MKATFSALRREKLLQSLHWLECHIITDIFYKPSLMCLMGKKWWGNIHLPMRFYLRLSCICRLCKSKKFVDKNVLEKYREYIMKVKSDRASTFILIITTLSTTYLYHIWQPCFLWLNQLDNSDTLKFNIYMEKATQKHYERLKTSDGTTDGISISWSICWTRSWSSVRTLSKLEWTTSIKKIN